MLATSDLEYEGLLSWQIWCWRTGSKPVHDLVALQLPDIYADRMRVLPWVCLQDHMTQ